MTVWELLCWFEDCWLDGAWGDIEPPAEIPSNRRYLRLKMTATKGLLLRVR